jgi:hypothetical protein
VRQELSFASDYGQVCLYDAGTERGDMIAALDDANAARLADAAPALDLEGREHVVGFPLALQAGRLTLEASGGGAARCRVTADRPLSQPTVARGSGARRGRAEAVARLRPPRRGGVGAAVVRRG